jgi:ligand-binding SRPBCC domain-containing protein
MGHVFKTEQWVAYPVELVFAFFASPGNLQALTPRWQRARVEETVLRPPPPRPVAAEPALRLRSVAAGEGSRITFSFRPFPFSPLRLPWEAHILEFDWNSHFTDVQVRGPFAAWHHRHSFETETRANEDGVPIHGTLVRDEIEYEIGAGALGRFTNQIFVQRRIRKLFEFRQRQLEKLLPRIFAGQPLASQRPPLPPQP